MKIICVGRNYAAHAAELGDELPAAPLLFGKFTNTLIGPGEAIVLPPEATHVDAEAELCIEIGTAGHRIPEARALEHVRGYRCANDLSARNIQYTESQWTRAKGFDTFGPLGPWMETAVDPADLGITTSVNGAVKQHARTSELLWDVPSLVEYVSSVMTLLPGDVLLTGTPEGVGPMTDGDEVSVTVESVGTLTNRVVIRD